MHTVDRSRVPNTSTSGQSTVAMRLRATWHKLDASAPPVALACSLAACGLWLVDALWNAAPVSPGFLMYGACLVLAGGALVGLGLSLLFMLTTRLPGWLRWGLWVGVSTGLGANLAIRLGALGRLRGQYSTTAWIVLTGASVGGLAAGLLAAAVQSATRRDVPARPTWVRVALGLATSSIAGALFYADRILYVGLYPDAHMALRCGAITMLALTIVLSATPLRLRRVGRADALFLAVIGTVPLWATWNADSSAFDAFGQRAWSLSLLRAARAAVDLDRDGAPRLLAGGDCNDWNPRIHPLAREIPDNGVDDNCIFGDAKRHADISENVAIPSEPSPLNVVLITVDTLTYNRIGAYDPSYGATGRNTMPSVEAWARRATVFQQAYAAGGWTSISLVSLMRGVYARKLRWTRFHETNQFRLLPATAEPNLAPNEEITKIFPLAWQDPHRPLASWLKRRGMRTHAVVDDGFSSMLNASLGCNEGFDRYDEVDHLPVAERNDAGTADMAIAALRSARKSGKPFFLWTHFFGPHTPNDTHRRVRTYGTEMSDLYDHEVRYLDGEIGRLLAALHKLRKNTAVFITADHGEAFGKGYRSHGFDLTESLIRVPLIARVPGWRRGTVEAPVSLVDLMPTILEITKTPAPAWLDGMSLTSFVRDPRHRPVRAFYTDTWQYTRKGEPFTDLVATFNGVHKVVLNRMDQTMETYLQRETPDARPRSQPLDEQRLTTQLRAYLEETGGTLQFAP